MAKLAQEQRPRFPIRRVALALLALIAIATLALGTFFAGHLIGAWQIFPHAHLVRIEDRVTRSVYTPSPQILADAVIPTALIRLRTEVGRVDFGRPAGAGAMSHNGGGLTAFGPDILLLPYSGRIYAASGPADIRDTGLSAPDNNRAAYLAASEDPAFAEYRFAPGFLRYNDLEYFRSATGHGLLASYTEWHQEEACATNTIARLDLPSGARRIADVTAAPEDWRVIFRTRPCLALKDYHLALEGHMAGGKLVFQAPDTVFLASGDFHLDGMRSQGAPIAQVPDAQYGKVLALNLDGTNPRIVSMGHRNMQGLALTRAGELVGAEHGPRGGDEINLIREGANYGWPLETYGTTYMSTALPNALSYGRHETFAQPIFAWVPSVATSAIVEVDGFNPAWDGDLLVGSLLDQALHRLRRQGDAIVYSERIPIGTRIRDIAAHPDGRLVMWSDNEELVFLSGESLLDIGARVDTHIRRNDLRGPIAEDLRAAIATCAECHSFQVDDDERAPSLAQIYGKPVASTRYAGYTPALAAKGGVWDHETLAAFLSDPQAFAPGTAMPNLELAGKPVLGAVIDYLQAIERDF